MTVPQDRNKPYVKHYQKPILRDARLNMQRKSQLFETKHRTLI